MTVSVGIHKEPRLAPSTVGASSSCWRWDSNWPHVLIGAGTSSLFAGRNLVPAECQRGAPLRPRRFAMWLGQNSSAGKQRRLMGELHTRMAAGPANVGTDRTGLRTAYLPALRASLVRPLVTSEQEGIPAVIATMQARARALPQGLQGFYRLHVLLAHVSSKNHRLLR